MNLLKMQFFESKINDLDYKNQIMLLANNEMVDYWWTGLLILGLGQGLQGRLGRMLGIWVLTFFAGSLLLFTTGIGAIYVVAFVGICASYDAYKYEMETNAYIKLLVDKRLKEL